jgi:D-threo-aldose 1-dehydrogenase
VFNSGILADPSHAATFDYKPARPSIVESAFRLQEICRANAVSLTGAAIQFPLRHPAVAAVLVGARSAQEIATDVEASIEPIPDAVWALLDGVEPTAGHDGPTP